MPSRSAHVAVFIVAHVLFVAATGASALRMATIALTDTLCDTTWQARVEIGTPPQSFYLQLDSGFHAMTLNTHGHRHCPNVPIQAYHANASSTSRMYTCADAMRDHVTKCLNCDGTNATANEACVSNTGLSPALNLTWGSDIVRIGGVVLPDFKISMQASTQAVPGTVAGSWGFKVDPASHDPQAPPWSSLMHDLKAQGAISELCYSTCFDFAAGKGLIDLGGLLPHTVAGAAGGGGGGITTVEPVRMVTGIVAAVAVGTEPVNMSASKTYGMGVDTGSLTTRFPSEMAKAMVAALERNCSANPGLVGVCVDAAGRKIAKGSPRSILRAQCYSLTPAQKNAYPDITVTLPAADGGSPR